MDRDAVRSIQGAMRSKSIVPTVSSRQDDAEETLFISSEGTDMMFCDSASSGRFSRHAI